MRAAAFNAHIWHSLSPPSSWFFVLCSSFIHKDKIADAKAKAAVKAQIEADKRARAEKAAREKALRQGLQPEPPAVSSTSQGPSKSVTGSAGVPSKEYKETRLQVN